MSEITLPIKELSRLLAEATQDGIERGMAMVNDGSNARSERNRRYYQKQKHRKASEDVSIQTQTVLKSLDSDATPSPSPPSSPHPSIPRTPTRARHLRTREGN